MKHWYLLIISLLVIHQVSAAEIHGSIYDLSLNRISDVRVEINTAPKQHYIAKNGTYSFNVPVGEYNIVAVRYIGTDLDLVRENISVKNDGNYVLDLILFPSYEEEKELLKDIGIDITRETKPPLLSFWTILAFFLIIILAVGITYYIMRRRKKKNIEQIQEEPKQQIHPTGDLQEIIKIVRGEGGRTTQKEIRKRIPLSEAKISLMIAELENSGHLKKIKKGRGNILILNK